MIRTLVLCLVVSLPVAAAAKHVYPKSLKPVEVGATYVLAEDYVYTEKAATFTLYAGSYVVRFEDSKAVYLIGSGKCVEMSVVPPKNPAAAWADRWECGIFLPRDPEKGAAFFMIRRTPDVPHSGNGWLIDEIIRAGYGSFDFPTSKHDDGLLRERLVVAQP